MPTIFTGCKNQRIVLNCVSEPRYGLKGKEEVTTRLDKGFKGLAEGWEFFLIERKIEIQV